MPPPVLSAGTAWRVSARIDGVVLASSASSQHSATSIGSAGRKKRQVVCKSRDRHLALVAGLQGFAEALCDGQVRGFAQSWPSQVGVDEQHTSPIGLRKHERNVQGRERLSLARDRARHHNGFEPPITLAVQ